ncbi:probable glutamate receptor [Procambarus clarkii]|uniref:probable glutamate receptor n=1 Tax=Procambarus clarkii TaxID=6728 RepID=UPI003743BEF4
MFTLPEKSQAAKALTHCERVRDGGWGSQVQGEWGGMVGELVRGEADIAVAALDITHKRSTAVDFLLGFLYSKYQLVMRRPSSSDYVWTAYTKQMENRAWAAMGAVVVLSLLVTTLVVICSGRRGHHISLSDTLITVLGFLMGQGGNVGLMPASLCVVAVTCLLLHQLLLAHYNSGLITALAVGPPLTLISNLNDINRNPSLTLGYVKGSSLTEHFKATCYYLLYHEIFLSFSKTSHPSQDSPAQVYQETYQSVESKNFKNVVGSLEEGIERVLKEEYVFMECEASLLYKYGQDCRLYCLPEAYFPSQASFALPKGSPLLPVFNRLVLEMQSSGVLRKLQEDWAPRNMDNCNQLHTEPIQLKILFTVYLVLCSGMVISVLVLIGEIFIARLMKAPKP